MKRTVKIIKNGEVVELEQGGEYIVDGKKYAVNIDFESGEITLGYICKDENISADIVPKKLSLYANDNSMDSKSDKIPPVYFDFNNTLNFEKDTHCFYCLNEERKKIKNIIIDRFIINNNFSFALSSLKNIVYYSLSERNDKNISFSYYNININHETNTFHIKPNSLLDYINLFEFGYYNFDKIDCIEIDLSDDKLNLQVLLNFLSVAKFINFKKLVISGDLYVVIEHYEKDGKKCKSIVANIDKINDINYISDCFKAINSIYINDMNTVDIKDDDENTILSFYTLPRIYSDNSFSDYLIFSEKRYNKYTDQVCFDKVIINGSVCKNISELPIFKCCDLEIKTLDCNDTIQDEPLINPEIEYIDGEFISCSIEDYERVKPYVNAPKVIITNRIILPNKLFSDVEELKCSNYNVLTYGTGIESPKKLNGSDESAYEQYLKKLSLEDRRIFIDELIENLNECEQDYYSDNYYKINYSGFIGKDKDFVHKFFGAEEEILKEEFVSSLYGIKKIQFYENLKSSLHSMETDKKIIGLVDIGSVLFDAQCKNIEEYSEGSNSDEYYKYYNEIFLFSLDEKGIYGTSYEGSFEHIKYHWDNDGQDESIKRSDPDAQYKSLSSMKNIIKYVTSIETLEKSIDIKNLDYLINLNYSNDSKKHYIKIDGKKPIFTQYKNTYLTECNSDNNIEKSTCEVIKSYSIDELIKDQKQDQEKIEKNGNVEYTFTKNDDGSIEITWENNSDIDAKFFTINDTKVLIPVGEG